MIFLAKFCRFIVYNNWSIGMITILQFKHANTYYRQIFNNILIRIPSVLDSRQNATIVKYCQLYIIIIGTVDIKYTLIRIIHKYIYLFDNVLQSMCVLLIY